MRIVLAVLALAAMAALSIVIWNFGREVIAVDDCLRAGGSYDYQDGACDLNVPHPYIPYSERHPAAIPVAASAGAVCLLAAVALHRRRP